MNMTIFLLLMLSFRDAAFVPVRKVISKHETVFADGFGFQVPLLVVMYSVARVSKEME